MTTMTQRCLALLGRPDTPTDAVEDFCQYLSQALAKRGMAMELLRVKWEEHNWEEALREIRRKAEKQGGGWFLLQYTALAWSHRGFPLRVLKLVRFAKNVGARCAVVFHDAVPYPGSRIIDKLRREVQISVMRRILGLADLAVFPVPPEKVSWIPMGSRNIVFIPVGANLPSPEKAWSMEKNKPNDVPTVCVFSVAPGRAGSGEVELIESAARCAARNLGKLRLIVAGRNSEEAGKELRQRLASEAVEVVIHGVLPAEEIVRVLGACQAMLFPRGEISSRRGSALAGIACGLPVVAREGPETGWPISEAGVILLPRDQKLDYGKALLRVLSDRAYALSLEERSRQAYLRYFSWDVIAGRYLEALRGIRSSHKLSTDQNRED
jgi:glycosyltransferase involved in cell wall biosynthesis